MHALERDNPVEALTTGRTEFVELCTASNFHASRFDPVDERAEHDRIQTECLSSKTITLHIGITEADEVSGAEVGRRDRHAARRRLGDRSAQLFEVLHARRRARSAWGDLRRCSCRRGPVLLACPDVTGACSSTWNDCVTEIERRLDGLRRPGQVAVLGAPVQRHRPRRRTPNSGIPAPRKRVDLQRGKPLRKVRTEPLVDVLFAEIESTRPPRGSTSTSARQRGRGPVEANEDATALKPELLGAIEEAEGGRGARRR